MIEPFRIGNRNVYLRKAIKTPNWNTDRVLTQNTFKFAELWLSRNKQHIGFKNYEVIKSLWKQAENYYTVSKTLPAVAAPLTLHYCYLNAIKALLRFKGIQYKYTNNHGISGSNYIKGGYSSANERTLESEVVTLDSEGEKKGITPTLSKYLGEPEKHQHHTLKDLLANLVFIHRAYEHTFREENHSFDPEQEFFIPLKNAGYKINKETNRVYFSAEIKDLFLGKTNLQSLASNQTVDFHEDFEIIRKHDKNIIQSKKDIEWLLAGVDEKEKKAAFTNLHAFHRKLRMHLDYISAPLDLWYIKQNKVNNTPIIKRYNITIIMLIMHRLSELARYEPGILAEYLDSRANWLLREFIQFSPHQFIDELTCEMTSLELAVPGIRP
ncbi:hypothetical protein COTS27_00155 [Spirochaetota bacterium]|nr:hypothetical protein COTS27_00155 [Spirochaetota bacterium]